MTELVRFGIAMESRLLERLDAVAASRKVTRSEVIRDLVRAEIFRAEAPVGVPAVAALTLVYDHHVRQLTEKLTEMQHDLGDQVRSTMHVHLDHDRCLEVIVLRGQSDELQALAETILATRGVTHGGIQIVPAAAAAEASDGAVAHRHPQPARKKR